MLFRKIDLKEKISEGAVFHRDMLINTIEQAKVLYVSEDDLGNSHVHYERTLIGTCYKEPQGIRVLAVDTFAKDFQVN